MPQRRCLGWLGLASERPALEEWAAAQQTLLRFLPFESPPGPSAVGGLDLLVIDAALEPLLAVAECARLRGLAPALQLSLLGAACELRAAAERAGAGFLRRPAPGKIPWRALARALASTRSITDGAELICEGFSIDRRARLVRVWGRERVLSSAKFELLCYLVDHAGRAVGARELVQRGILLQSQAARYKCVMFELRAQLGSASRCIRAVPGHGYRLLRAPPAASAAEEPVASVARADAAGEPCSNRVRTSSEPLTCSTLSRGP